MIQTQPIHKLESFPFSSFGWLETDRRQPRGDIWGLLTMSETRMTYPSGCGFCCIIAELTFTFGPSVGSPISALLDGLLLLLAGVVFAREASAR